MLSATFEITDSLPLTANRFRNATHKISGQKLHTPRGGAGIEKYPTGRDKDAIGQVCIKGADKL
jgi:hypothetical protein